MALLKYNLQQEKIYIKKNPTKQKISKIVLILPKEI